MGKKGILFVIKRNECMDSCVLIEIEHDPVWILKLLKISLSSFILNFILKFILSV